MARAPPNTGHAPRPCRVCTPSRLPPAASIGRVIPVGEVPRSTRATTPVYRATPELRHHLWSGAIPETSCAEDSRSELRALSIGASDRVLSVTGDGCRSLNLLLASPLKLLSVDPDPLRNFLLELKAAALAELPRDAFLRFVGVRSCDNRLLMYGAIRPRLSDGAVEFWDLNTAVIRRGVIFSGARETYHRKTLGTLLLARRQLVRRLFALRDLTAQRALYHEMWNDSLWRVMLRMAYHGALRWRLPPGAFAPRTPLAQPLHTRLHDRFEQALTHHLARDDGPLAVLLLGRYYGEHAVPLYLREEHYYVVRARLDRLRIVTAPVEGVLASLPEGWLDAVSLGDLADRTAPPQFDRVLTEAVRAGRIAGRVMYRTLLAPRPLPVRLLEQLQPLDDLASEIALRDTGFAHSFQLGQFLGPLEQI